MNDSVAQARSKVMGPALSLIIVSCVSIVILLLALLFDVWLLLSGVAGEMRQPEPMSKETQLGIRMAWSLLMLATSAVIALGGVRMKSLQGHGLARLACILAVIPCIGPCFIFGVPFGFWELVVLQDPLVRQSFTD